MDLDENDSHYETIPRRLTERRNISRRTTKPAFITHEEVRKLRKLNQNKLIPLRHGDRRKNDRRKSRPKLLSYDEIVILRTK